jgi:hypothetical protein
MVVLSIFSGFFLCQQYNTSFFFHWHLFFYFISNNNCQLLTTVQHYVWQLRSAILLALKMMNEWIPDFFFKYFYAGIVQSNLCWKIHNKYVFHVNIHIFVLKYLAQKQIIQNQFKISEGGKWNSHQMPCVYSSQFTKG